MNPIQATLILSDLLNSGNSRGVPFYFGNTALCLFTATLFPGHVQNKHMDNVIYFVHRFRTVQ